MPLADSDAPKNAKSEERDSLFRGLNGMASSNDAVGDGDDSEAETERLHESPTKKRLAEEVLLGKEKRSRRNDYKSDSDPEDEQFAKAEAEDAKPLNTDSPSAEAAKSSDDNESSSGEGPAKDSEDEEANDDESRGSDRESNEERMKALKALTEIEVEFARVRDSLHDQQIAKFDLEILMCSEGSHPDLEQYNIQIREECNTRLQRTTSLLAYQMDAIYNQSRASRCSVYQTFLKSKYALRNDLLNEATKRWYQVNHERMKLLSCSPDYGYVAGSKPHKIPRPTLQSLNISQHPGLMNFPLAPSMSQVTELECHTDLRDIGLR